MFALFYFHLNKKQCFNSIRNSVVTVKSYHYSAESYKMPIFCKPFKRDASQCTKATLQIVREMAVSAHACRNSWEQLPDSHVSLGKTCYFVCLAYTTVYSEAFLPKDLHNPITYVPIMLFLSLFIR